jgi:hypothetical protein
VTRRKVAARLCEAYACATPLEVGARADARYCSKTCRQKMARARGRARARVAENKPRTLTDEVLAAHDHVPLTMPHYNTTTDAASATAQGNRTPAEAAAGVIPPTAGGAGFQKFIATPLPQSIDDGHITRRQAALTLEVSAPTVTAWMDLYHAFQSQTRAQSGQSPASTALAAHALSSFRAFNEVLFPDNLLPWFHDEWDNNITGAIDVGERNLLLASQRHGKTDFMIRQCIYRIALNPNICIMWVGKTADLASKAVGVIRQYLENDPTFAAVLLPPETSFKPPARRGIKWTNDEFTVATRDTIRKSPTMVALGIGGTIIGRDADVIVIDDPIDRSMCLSQTERTKVEEWFYTDFASRIEEHTGVVYIGSRQHKDDLPGRIISNNAARVTAGLEPDWNVHIYRAHDTSCPHDLDTHPVVTAENPDDSGTCLLWPTKRTAAWLGEQQRNNEEHFERNYQANPLGTLHRPITGPDILRSYATDAAVSVSLWGMDHPRAFGTVPPGWRLVASLDPAIAKRNAATLVAYPPGPVGITMDPYNPTANTRPIIPVAIVDYAEPPPGTPGVMEVLEKWTKQYPGLNEWVFETNLYADQIANDRDINDFKSRHGLRFHTHWTTQYNKHDSHAGVLAMLASARKSPSPILMPGTTPESAKAMERLSKQMLDYDPEATHASNKKRLDDDLIMALWFAWYWIEQKTRVVSTHIEYEYPEAFSTYGPSNWAAPPWESIA